MKKNGPFGLWMGMCVEDVGSSLDVIAPSKYSTNFVPKPHSAFSEYILTIAPGCGLSWIKAIGRSINTSAYGTELISAFEIMAKKLSSTYGQFDAADFLMSDSIWDQPRDWMQGVCNKERFLGATWSVENGSSLENNLTSVYLGVSALDDTTGFIFVEYLFENDDIAEEEIAALEDDAL